MKMVAAAELRRAQRHRKQVLFNPMDRMIAALAGKMNNIGGPALLAGTGSEEKFCCGRLQMRTLWRF